MESLTNTSNKYVFDYFKATSRGCKESWRWQEKSETAFDILIKEEIKYSSCFCFKYNSSRVFPSQNQTAGPGIQISRIPMTVLPFQVNYTYSTYFYKTNMKLLSKIKWLRLNLVN